MMNTSNWIRQIMIFAVFALVAVAAAGAEMAGERYIVILKSRCGPAPDVARLGGTITFRQDDQLNVTLPREAVNALRADPLVRYIQAVAGADDAPLSGDALPFQTGAVNTVITNNVPINAGMTYFGQSFTSSEIYRVLSTVGQWIGSSAP
jgi:hypothetical protein